MRSHKVGFESVVAPLRASLRVSFLHLETAHGETLSFHPHPSPPLRGLPVWPVSICFRNISTKGPGNRFWFVAVRAK